MARKALINSDLIISGIPKMDTRNYYLSHYQQLTLHEQIVFDYFRRNIYFCKGQREIV